MAEAFIVDAVRTAAGKGKRGGALAGVHPADLAATTIGAVVERAGIDPAGLDDVITGVVGQNSEQSSNLARWAALAAGLPESVPGVTVDRQCGSSQQAVHFAAALIGSGAAGAVIAGGVESMSRVPIGSQTLGQDPHGPAVRARYPGGLPPQGISAELVALRWALSREQLDVYAERSHRRAAAAQADLAFDAELVAVQLPGGGSHRHDETVRPGTNSAALAGLSPAFFDSDWQTRFPEIDWRVTAGNSSPLTDGSSAALLVSAETLSAHDLSPRARVVAHVTIGSDPVLMLAGVVPATEAVLARAGLRLDQIDAFEVNEAFACVPLAWLNDTGADPELLNQHGGAIALGHPLGGSGTRLLATLLGVLDARGGRYGLLTMCEAGGMASALVVERLG